MGTFFRSGASELQLPVPRVPGTGGIAAQMHTQIIPNPPKTSARIMNKWIAAIINAYDTKNGGRSVLYFLLLAGWIRQAEYFSIVATALVTNPMLCYAYAYAM